jgi:hypothetical protein
MKLEARTGAKRASRHRTQLVQRLSREALPSVRSSALAWRNGLAGLLTGLLGFSLIKGRSDIGKLAMPWSAFVGVALLVALVIGAYGAMNLLSAAHGRPKSIPRAEVTSRLAADHEAATHARRALNRGIAAVLACTAFLVAAVAMTWYGPEKSPPKLRVVVAGESICGSVVRLASGILTLRTEDGERAMNLAEATGMTPVAICGPAQ